ncbi:MAG: hypothetical protein RLZ39_77, partial [Bacteroidota bacterium]
NLFESSEWNLCTEKCGQTLNKAKILDTIHDTKEK